MTATIRRRTLRGLFEEVATSAAALKVDRERGVIYGVRVLGRYSKNNHGILEATLGTEYTPECMRQALPLYEGAKVKADHPLDRSRPGAERPVEATLGLLKQCRIRNDENGNPCIYADLYYYRSHPMADRVVEDVERRLGGFGLSHNAASSKERLDGGRLVIEEITVVRSVDLVDKPATNRTLWEGQRPTIRVRPSPKPTAWSAVARACLDRSIAAWDRELKSRARLESVSPASTLALLRDAVGPGSRPRTTFQKRQTALQAATALRDGKPIYREPIGAAAAARLLRAD
jgi:hypothetical protein